MADIKTRDVIRGSIKTLDRAASSMHHLKEETVKSKVLDISSRQDGDNADTYVQGTVEHYAGDSEAYAVQAGAGLIMRNRQKEAESSDYPQNSEEQIRQAFVEQGVKTIRARQQEAKLADAEALHNTEEVSFAGRIRPASARKNSELIHKKRGRAVNNRQFIPERIESAQRSRKELAIRRIVGKKETAVYPLNLFTGEGRLNVSRRRANTASRFMTFLWEHARTAATPLGVGGAATLIILTLFVFFGVGIITFSNNSPDTSITDPEEIEYFIPDLAGSPTREAIVKAAAREVGNVGGEKFWRWYGFNYHVHWCACFTLYIAAECGCIKSGICPKSALVDDWISFYKKQHRWAGRNYIPHSGDFILFDWEGDGQPDHIGIVESCDGKQ